MQTSFKHAPLTLHPDRFFDPDPSVRAVATSLYEETRDLPLICPHGHVEPSVLADDSPFPEPTALLPFHSYTLPTPLGGPP